MVCRSEAIPIGPAIGAHANGAGQVVGVSLESILRQNRCDFINDLYLWFRSFRVKLSVIRMMHKNHNDFIHEMRGLFSET
jgi:hypothetical protein